MKEEFDRLIYDFLSGSITKEDLHKLNEWVYSCLLYTSYQTSYLSMFPNAIHGNTWNLRHRFPSNTPVSYTHLLITNSVEKLMNTQTSDGYIGNYKREAQLTTAQQNLSFTQVKSPSDGVINNIPYRVGALVSPCLLYTSIHR